MDYQASISGLSQHVCKLDVMYTSQVCCGLDVFTVLVGLMKSAMQNFALSRHRTTDQRGPGIRQISMWLEDSSLHFAFGLFLFIYSNEF